MLIAFDGSPAAHAAIASAADLLRSGPAVVLTVWQSVEELVPAAAVAIPTDVAGRGAEELDAATVADAERLAAEGAEQARSAGLEAQPRAVRSDGSVWAGICRTARELDASAVVVGSRGRSGIKSVLLGSISTAVMHHADRPVLVVSEPET